MARLKISNDKINIFDESGKERIIYNPDPNINTIFNIGINSGQDMKGNNDFMIKCDTYSRI